MSSKPETNRLPPAEQREHLMVRAAKLHYDLQYSRIEVAKELGLTRWQVSKLLEEARAEGIVQIKIEPRSKRLVHLESELQRRYGLQDALVVQVPPNLDASLDFVAAAAGSYLASISSRVPLLGVSWGRTLAAVARWLPVGWHSGVEVVLVNGATTIRATSEHNNMVAEVFAARGNGRATLLPVPAIVGSTATRIALEQDPVISTVLQRAHAATAVIFALGSLAADNVLVESGYLSTSDLEQLRDRHAIGDVLGRFINRDGEIACPELDARTIGLELEALRRVKHAIAVSTGAAKHELVLSAVRAGLLNVLITDDETANFLLEQADA